MRLLLFILCISFVSFSNENVTENESKFAQFIVVDVDNREKAITIDEFMRSQPGVSVSRMDHISKKYLIIFSSDMSYDHTYFLKTFESLGYTIKCYRDGIHGKDAIVHQTPDC